MSITKCLLAISLVVSVTFVSCSEQLVKGAPSAPVESKENTVVNKTANVLVPESSFIVKKTIITDKVECAKIYESLKKAHNQGLVSGKSGAALNNVSQIVSHGLIAPNVGTAINAGSWVRYMVGLDFLADVAKDNNLALKFIYSDGGTAQTYETIVTLPPNPGMSTMMYYGALQNLQIWFQASAGASGHTYYMSCEASNSTSTPLTTNMYLFSAGTNGQVN